MARKIAAWALALFSAFSNAAPDEAILGAAEGYPLCPIPIRGVAEERCLVGLYSHYGEILPSRVVAKAASPRALKRSDKPLPPVEPFLQQNRNTGLLVMRGDTIHAERYQYGRKAEHRMASMSMAKSVVSLLIGIAIANGKIASIDELAERYVPELKGHPYGETSLRHLLTMTSGVRFTERYDGNDDITALSRATMLQQGPGGPQALLPFNVRERPAGERFSYSSAETVVLAHVLRAATGQPVSDYLSEKIWKPMGAEADASWNLDKSGYELGYCCLNATLRDYGRLGMLLANGGSLDGRQIVPADWLRAATAPGTVNPGYGYKFWVAPRGIDRFSLIGIRGQAINVDPATRTIVVHTAVRRLASDPELPGLQRALFNDILKVLGTP
jgi:CubicO group peptidase (beta-lactamase class C family)